MCAHLDPQQINALRPTIFPVHRKRCQPKFNGPMSLQCSVRIPAAGEVGNLRDHV